jgi:hypothetical protein
MVSEELWRILETKGVQTVKGPVNASNGGVESLRFTIKLMEDAIPAVRERIVKELKYFESRIKQKLRKVASTGSAVLLAIPKNQIRRASYRQLIGA